MENLGEALLMVVLTYCTLTSGLLWVASFIRGSLRAD
jgi:hypothetical protein